MKIKKRYWRGSYTVEAALVVSIILFVLSALLVCTFYIHDRAVLQASTCEIAAAGSNFALSQDRQQAVNDAKASLTNSRLLGSRDRSGNASVSNKTVTASWSAVYPVPGFAMRYLASGSLKIQRSWKMQIFSPSEMIWKIKGIGDLFAGGEK